MPSWTAPATEEVQSDGGRQRPKVTCLLRGRVCSFLGFCVVNMGWRIKKKTKMGLGDWRLPILDAILSPYVEHRSNFDCPRVKYSWKHSRFAWLESCKAAWHFIYSLLFQRSVLNPPCSVGFSSLSKIPISNSQRENVCAKVQLKSLTRKSCDFSWDRLQCPCEPNYVWENDWLLGLWPDCLL